MSTRAPRIDTWLFGTTGLLAVLTGLLAGFDGRLAIAGAIGVGFVLISFADLTLGLALFTFLGFLIAMPALGAATQNALKLATVLPLCLSWLAITSRQDRGEQNFTTAHPAVTMAMGMLLVWACLSLVWAESGSEVMQSGFRWILAMALMLITYTAVRKLRDVELVLGAFVLGAVFSAVYGLVMPAAAVPGLENRFTGTLGDPNQFASAMVLGIGLSGGLFAVGRSSVTKLTALGSMLICFSALFLTGSRGGLIALAVMLVAGVFLAKGRRLVLGLIAVLIALAGITYVVAAAPPEIRERILNPGGGSGRTDVWTVGGRMVSANPVHGVGAGNFPVSSIHYLLQPGSLPDDQFIVDTPQVAHNMYLEVLAELGIVGFGLFLSIVIFSLGCLLAALSRFRALEERTLQALTTSIAISMFGLLAADLFLSEQQSPTLWLLLGLGPALLAIAKRLELSSAPNAA